MAAGRCGWDPGSQGRERTGPGGAGVLGDVIRAHGSEWQGLLCPPFPAPPAISCHPGRRVCVSQGTLTSEAVSTLTL